MPYISKITNQALADTIGMNVSQIQRYLSGGTKIKDISSPQGTKQYDEARDTYIYNAKVGVLITRYANEQSSNPRFVELMFKKDKPSDELKRLQTIGLTYGKYIDAEFLDNLIR